MVVTAGGESDTDELLGQSTAVAETIGVDCTTLDDHIPDDHPVLAEILEGYDWSAWEARYLARLGQPPIHPLVLVALWLYGLRRGIRSSRKLEYMAGHNIDFM